LGEGAAGVGRSVSAPTVSGLSTLSQFGRLWATTGDLVGNDNNASATGAQKKVEKRRVKFQAAVRVVLIPSRNEYINAGMGDVLWWEESDYSVFKRAAVSELKMLMQSEGILDSKVAIQMMYQPGYLPDDMSFEEEVPTRGRSDSSPLASPLTLESMMESVPTMISAPSSSSVREETTQAAEEQPVCDHLGLIGARDDVDLLEHGYHDTHGVYSPACKLKKSPEEQHKQLHPLAYMCA
jgi:hypothetical protein